MSKHCPLTHQHCHNPLCEKNICLLDYGDKQHDYTKEERKILSAMIEEIKRGEELLLIINKQADIIHDLIKIEHHHRKHQRTQLVLSGLKYQSFTIKNSIIMAISLNINDVVTSTLGLVDHTTQAPITSAVFSNQTYVSDQPSIASVDASGTVTAVSQGVANITFKADVAYTGADGTPKTETGKTLVVAVTVQGAPQTTDLTVTFGTPAAKA